MRKMEPYATYHPPCEWSRSIQVTTSKNTPSSYLGIVVTYTDDMHRIPVTASVLSLSIRKPEHITMERSVSPDEPAWRF